MLNVGGRAGLMLGASLITLALAGPALAADVMAESQINAVTVYATGASVVRDATVDLPAGASTVVIGGLPDELDADSLKVEGSGDQSFAIASVETAETPAGDAEADPARAPILAAIQDLKDKIGAVGDRIDALNGRKQFLDNLIAQAPSGFAKALGDGSSNISGWATAASTIGNGLADVATAIRAASVEQRDLQKQIDAEQKQLDALPPAGERREVRIAVSAGAATHAAFEVTYRVASATWKPAYTAELVTGDGGGDPSLTLVRRAIVTQTTGEEWNGVHLTLSTTRPEGGTGAPDLEPTLVSLEDADSYSQNEASGVAAAPPAADALAGRALDATEQAPAPKPADVVEAAADFGDFHAAYEVPGEVSVASGKGARSVQLASDKLTPDLAVKTAPAVAETAYLTASFTPPAGAPLLAGDVSLFRDGSFVGNGTIAFSEAGRQVDLGFGVDDRVHVTRATLTEQTGQHGFIVNRRKTDVRSYKITVANLHTRPMTITVLDRVPYAEDTAIEVVSSKDATQPTVTNVDDRRGVLAWTYQYAAGESRDILNSFQVSWPADRDIVSMD